MQEKISISVLKNNAPSLRIMEKSSKNVSFEDVSEKNKANKKYSYNIKNI